MGGANCRSPLTPLVWPEGQRDSLGRASGWRCPPPSITQNPHPRGSWMLRQWGCKSSVDFECLWGFPVIISIFSSISHWGHFLVFLFEHKIRHGLGLPWQSQWLRLCARKDDGNTKDPDCYCDKEKENKLKRKKTKEKRYGERQDFREK